jgi:hypothetical protein
MSSTSTALGPELAALARRSFLQNLTDEIASRWVLYLGGGLVFAILITVGIVLLNIFTSS